MGRLLRIGLCVLALPVAAADPVAVPDYSARLKTLDRKDPAAWMDLADFCEARLMLDKRDEALRRALKLDPALEEAHWRLGEDKVGGRWMGAVEALAAEARWDREQAAKGLDFFGNLWMAPAEARALRAKTAEEVGWPVQIRWDGSYFTLFSGRSPAFTRKLAALLEDVVQAYRRLYGEVWTLKAHPEVPIRVYLFPGRLQFEQVASRETGARLGDGNGGFYSTATRVLYVGEVLKDPSESQILLTAVHEMVHGLDHHLAGLDLSALPRWVQEGRANHMAYGMRDRRVIPGLVAIAARDAMPTHLASALEGLPLGVLVSMDKGGFMQRQEQCYALSWAWVHFLLHADAGRHAEGFRSYLRGLSQGSGREDLERALGPLEGLEGGFKQYARRTLPSQITFWDSRKR